MKKKRHWKQKNTKSIKNGGYYDQKSKSLFFFFRPTVLHDHAASRLVKIIFMLIIYCSFEVVGLCKSNIGRVRGRIALEE